MPSALPGQVILTRGGRREVVTVTVAGQPAQKLDFSKSANSQYIPVLGA
jgi:hypothetical protein